MAVARFEFVTVDAIDPDRLAAFWSAVFGSERGRTYDDGRFVFVRGGEGAPTMCFQRVPESKTAKGRMHLDLGVDDLDAATARIEELGGRWADGEERRLGDAVWRTMLDPEGNEFDITRDG